MIGHLDLDLLSAQAASTAQRQGALELHHRWLKRCTLRLLWREEFECHLPWGQPSARDICIAVIHLLEYLRGNQRLLFDVEAPALRPALSPDLTHGYPEDSRDQWLGLVAWSFAQAEAMVGLAVLTWPQTGLAAQITATAPAAAAVALDVLQDDASWQRFWRNYHRPDLTGRHVVVLGGQRAAVERAGQMLERLYRLGCFHYLPPAYEQNRNQKATRDALLQADMLVVCTNRLKHQDTDHLKGPGYEVPCARRNLHADTMQAIVDEVVTYFLDLEERETGHVR